MLQSESFKNSIKLKHFFFSECATKIHHKKVNPLKKKLSRENDNIFMASNK